MCSLCVSSQGGRGGEGDAGVAMVEASGKEEHWLGKVEIVSKNPFLW